MTQRSQQRFGLPKVPRTLSKFHRFLYVLFNGRILARRGNAHFLLLTTTGRRTKRLKTVPLLFLLHNGSPAVIASVGGSPKAPAWILNIRNDPSVKVQIGGVRRDGVARFADNEERQELWPRFVECYAGYEGYQAKTSRIFPIVVITMSQD